MGHDDDEERIYQLQQLLASLEETCKQAGILRAEVQRRLADIRRRDLPVRTPTERRRKPR